MAWYRTGTVSVTNGSATVTGAGTAWVGAARAGWGFNGPDGRLYEVLSVNSDTQITLGGNYLGSTQTGQAYSVFPTRGEITPFVTQLQAVINTMQATIDGAGAGKFGDGTVGTPGIRFTADTDTGLYRPAANQLGLAAGGVARMLLSSTAAQIDVPITGTAVQASAHDATAGRAARVFAAGGIFGWGNAADASPAVTDANAVLTSGAHRTTAATTGLPVAAIGTLIVTVATAGVVQQIWMPSADGATRMHVRRRTGGLWQAWSEIYGQANILGTVSQAAGVPTGALIETGSNANGSYVKLAGGTMICSHILDLGSILAYGTGDRDTPYRTNQVNWVFPASFIAAPVVSATGSVQVASVPARMNGVNYGTVSTNSVSNIIVFRSSSASDAANGVVNLSAIGRWY